MAEIQKSDTLLKELKVKQKWIIQDENLVDFYKKSQKNEQLRHTFHNQQENSCACSQSSQK